MATLLINNAVVDMAAKNISALSLTVSYDAPRQFVFEENCRHYSASYQNEAKVEYRNAAGTTVFLGRIKGIVKSGAPGNEAVQYSCFGLRTLAQEVKIVEQSYGIPRVAFNAEQDDEDYDAALSGMTVGEIIQWLFDNHADASAVVTKGLREAGVIAASPATGYVQAELDLLTAIPPKIALAGDNFDSAMISIMRYQKGWRFIAYPDTQVYHFVKVEDLTAATITYNYTDYVEKVQVNPNTSGRATAVKVIGPRKPTDTALKLSEGGLEESWDVAYEGDWTWDKSVTPGYEATYWRVYRRWRIVDPTKREMCAGLLQPYTGIEGLGTTKCPTFLVKRTNPDRWESVQFSADPANGYIYASNPQCEGNGGIAGMATPPTDVMLVYGYMGDPLTARWPAASFSGTAYESLDVPVTVETLLYDEDFREDAQTVDRLEVAKQLHAGASDIIYEGSADLLKLDWTYRNLGYLLNITSRTDAGVPITTGFESLKALISAVTYNFSEGDGTTTLQITTNYSAFADANLEEQLRLNQIEKDAREARIQNHRANRERYKYFCRWGWTGSNPPRTSTDALSGTLMKITERISATDYHAQPADKDGNATGDEVDVFNVGVSEWLVGDLVPVEQDMEGALVARAADLVGDDLWTQRDDTPVGYSQIKHIGPSATEATMGVGSDADGKVITQMSFDEKGHRSGGKARVLTGDLFWTEVTKPDANTLKVSHIGPSTAGHTIGGVGYLVQKLVTDLTGHIVTGDSATFDISGLAGPGLTWDVTALSVGMTTDPWLQAVVGADSTSLEHLGPQAAAYTGGDGSRYLPSVVKLDARGHGSTGDLGSYDLAGLAGPGIVWDDAAKTLSLGATGDELVTATVNADELEIVHAGPGAETASIGDAARYVVGMIGWDRVGHLVGVNCLSLDIGGMAGPGLVWNAGNQFSVDVQGDVWINAVVNEDSIALTHIGPDNPSATYGGDAEQKVVTELVVDATGHAVSGLGRTLTGDELWIMVTQPDANTLLVSHDGPDVVSSTFGDGSRYLPGIVNLDALGHGVSAGMASYDMASLAGPGLMWDDSNKVISLGATGDTWITATVNANQIALVHNVPGAVTIRDTTNQTGNTEFFAWRAQVYTDLAGHVWPTYGTRTGIRYWNTWYSDGLTWDPAPVYKMRVNVEAPIVTTGAKVGLSYDDTEFTLTGNMLELNKTYLAGDGLQATETNLNVHYSADTLTLDESSPRYLAVNMANMTTGAMRVSGHQFSVDYNPPIILDVQNKLSVQARNGVTIDVGGYVAANPTDGPYLLPTAIDGDGHVTSYVSKYLITA